MSLLNHAAGHITSEVQMLRLHKEARRQAIVRVNVIALKREEKNKTKKRPNKAEKLE